MTKTRTNGAEAWRHRLTWFALCGACLLLVGCEKSRDPDDLLTLDDSEVHRDRERYARMQFYVMSYVDYDMYGIYILPANKNSLAFAIAAPPLIPSQTNDKWGDARSGDNFYWDRNWSTPRQFKVWWFRVVDAALFKQNNQNDRYTSKETRPGAAWCEAIITIDKPPPSDAGYFVLHFYPDGHVEAHLSGPKKSEATQPRYTLADRDKLPVLQGKPCLKEIPNPYYGLKKPIAMN